MTEKPEKEAEAAHKDSVLHDLKMVVGGRRDGSAV